MKDDLIFYVVIFFRFKLVATTCLIMWLLFSPHIPITSCSHSTRPYLSLTSFLPCYIDNKVVGSFWVCEFHLVIYNRYLSQDDEQHISSIKRGFKSWFIYPDIWNLGMFSRACIQIKLEINIFHSALIISIIFATQLISIILIIVPILWQYHSYWFAVQQFSRSVL